MEFLEYIKEFIRPELLVLVPVLYLIGGGLKKAQAFADKYIPLVLGGVGVGLAAMWVLGTVPISGWQEGVTALFTAIVQGVLVAGAGVYCNQIIKQASK